MTLPPSPEKIPGMTVGQLRESLCGIDDKAEILVEDNGNRYSIATVWTVGHSSDEPGVIIRLLRIR